MRPIRCTHFGIGRHVNVDHCFELRDVEPARGDVGCDEHRAAPVRKLDQYLIALALLELAMQRERMEALRTQHVEQVAALLLRVAERERADRPIVLQQQPDRMQSLVIGHLVEALANLAVVVALFEFHLLRIPQDLPAQLCDPVWVGRREQQRLPFRRTLAHDRRDVVEEPHVEHPVRFVEHERLQRAEREIAAFEMVHDAPRRTDDDMRAVLEACRLRTHWRAAAERQHFHVFLGAREAADFLRDLIGKLARRAEHHRLHVEAARVEPREQRERERCGFAAAGLRLRDQVVTRERDRQARGLDRRHVGVTKLREIREYGGASARVLKGGAVGSMVMSLCWVTGAACLRVARRRLCRRRLRSARHSCARRTAHSGTAAPGLRP